jgi:hypothetical protein
LKATYAPRSMIVHEVSRRSPRIEDAEVAPSATSLLQLRVGDPGSAAEALHRLHRGSMNLERGHVGVTRCLVDEQLLRPLAFVRLVHRTSILLLTVVDLKHVVLSVADVAPITRKAIRNGPDAFGVLRLCDLYTHHVFTVMKHRSADQRRAT